MPIGTVKFFNSDKGYGFVHVTAVERAGMATLGKDQRVSYELETGRDGKISAVNLETA